LRRKVVDLPGEKLLIKMWETLTEKSIGSLLSPWHEVRKGQARIEVRRQELLMLAQAKIDAADIRAGRKRLHHDGSLRLVGNDRKALDSSATAAASVRIEPKINLQSLAEVSVSIEAAEVIRSEINVSKAVIFAEECLANDPQIPPERTVDEDWLFTWRGYAGKVSAEDLQRLWGNILAGEIKSPGNYSLRTLEFLKGLSTIEAELIAKLAPFVIESIIVRSQKQHLEEQGVSFDMLLKLQELGIVSGAEAIGLTMSYKALTPEKFLRAFRSNGKALIIEHEDPNKVLTIEVYMLTMIGAQLLSLGSFEPNIQYLRLVGREVAAKGFTASLADWVQVSENQGRYRNAESIPS
jgi:hypothetical protein